MFSQETVVIGLLKYSLGIDNEECTQEELEFGKKLIDLDCMFSSDGDTDEMVFATKPHGLVVAIDREDNTWWVDYSFVPDEFATKDLAMRAIFSTGNTDDTVDVLENQELCKMMTMVFYPIIKYFLDKVGIEVGEGAVPLINTPLH